MEGEGREVWREGEGEGREIKEGGQVYNDRIIGPCNTEGVLNHIAKLVSYRIEWDG